MGPPLGARDARGEGPSARVVRPPPPPGLPGTLPASPPATSARHVLPPRPAPRAPPGLGAGTGGRGRTWRARRLEARAGERGAAGRSGRPGVWASGAPVSRPPRGAPGPGVGRAGGRNPRPEAAWREAGRAGARGPSGARGGLGRPAWEGPVTPGGKCGLGLCQPTLPRVRSRAPWEPGDPAGRPGRPGWAARRRRWRGGFQECAVGVADFRTSARTLPSQTEGSLGILSRRCRLQTSLKLTTFYFLFSSAQLFL